MLKHVQKFWNSLQIVKCFDEICRKPFNTYCENVFPKRYIEPPTSYGYNESGLTAIEPKTHFKNPKDFMFSSLNQRLIMQKEPESANRFLTFPMDWYCPSMEEKIKKGICCKCGHYWSSQAAIKQQKKVIRKISNSD